MVLRVIIGTKQIKDYKCKFGSNIKTVIDPMQILSSSLTLGVGWLQYPMNIEI